MVIKDTILPTNQYPKRKVFKGKSFVHKPQAMWFGREAFPNT